ncbi:MAG: HEAT repeat domain-containing protein [Planctomycetota bacterium]|nr:HEAT repeat domain-containing protein [Planctomycetota bacterium]MDA1112904.1 HEAT repeat domain-containing protein [Planctomycetota bacterium]
MTDLFFCNICDQSVPLARMEDGEAVRHGGRVICPTCCDAISMSQKNQGNAKSGGSMFFPLFIGLIACGACVFLYLEMDKVKNDSTVHVNDAVMMLHQSLGEVQLKQEASFAKVADQLDSLDQSLEEGMRESLELTDAVDTRVGSLVTQVDQLEGLADGQATLQQSVRNLQAQIQVSEEGLRGVRAGQEFLRDNIAELERKVVIATAAPVEANGFSSDVKALLGQLKDDDPLKRVSAIEKISKFDDPALIPYVEALLDDNYEMNRFYAANTLGNWNAMASVPALIQSLADNFAFVRKEANAALVEITKEDVGYDSKGSEKDRQKAAERWTEWWAKNSN